MTALLVGVPSSVVSINIDIFSPGLAILGAMTTIRNELGDWAYDPSTGLAYVATAQPAADWNASTRPGPNLWADAIMAVDETTGKFVWGFQTSAHDTWDWDCSWSVMLANVTINSQVTKAVYKGCKNGYMYALKPQRAPCFGASILLASSAVPIPTSMTPGISRR